jgi:hypothetical protein
MELLESPWFFRMVEQHGKTPAQRLIAIFSVTEAWMCAPGIRERMLASQVPSYFLYNSTELKAFLTGIAVSARADNPASLVNQLVILLQGAIAEEIRNPEARAIGEAGKAAQAIIDKACPRQRTLRLSLGGLAAAALIAAIGLYPTVRAQWMPAPVQPASHLVLASTDKPASFNPDSVEAVLALQEQIAKGICPAPQLLALPQGQVTAYMNVIHFRTPDDPIADSRNIRAFLAWFERTRSSECYHSPLNGHTTVAWVAG